MTWDGRKGTGGGGVSGPIYRTIPFKFLGSLTACVGKTKLRNNTPYTWTLESLQMLVEDAPAGGIVVGDLNVNGVTVFTNQANRPEIAPSALESDLVTTFDVSTVDPGDDVTCDIDIYTAPASNLQFFLTYSYTP